MLRQNGINLENAPCSPQNPDGMLDESLPAGLGKLEISEAASRCALGSSVDKCESQNPFRTTSRGLNPDTSHLFPKRSLQSRQSSTVSPRGVRTTTTFKTSRNERTSLDKPRKSSIIKEAVLKLSGSVNSSRLSETLASTLLQEACRISISTRNSKTFGQGSVTKDFKALNISQDSRRVKDDASIEEDYHASSFRRARSNTMPSLERGPGPGGGNPGPLEGQNPQGSGQSASTNTCSVQARISPPPCDVTIDELASYFDEFVHIPKKMSHMAEMMYI